MGRNTRNSIKINRLKVLLTTSFFITTFFIVIFFSQTSSLSISLGGSNLNSVVIPRETLYPEGIEYNPQTGKFLLSSVREGTIYEISEDGTYHPFIQDKRLISTIGIRIDKERNRLLVANSDYGVSVKTDKRTARNLAAIGIYNLSTAEPIAYVDLGTLRPNSSHFANDIAIDNEGNAYITDSLSPIIYKVSPQGNPSVFLEHERFQGKGFNLNGIVYHPDGYLIVAKKSEGALFKVPLDNPEAFNQIQTEQKFIGTDGLLLVDNDSLVVITNRVSGGFISNTVFALRNDDNWESATIFDNYRTGDMYPSTGTIKEKSIYIIYGRLNTLSGSDITTPIEEFKIQQVGLIK